MGINLGAIAKGYIADRIKDYLLEEGVESAIIDLGGNILCVGQRRMERPSALVSRSPSQTGAKQKLLWRSLISL